MEIMAKNSPGRPKGPEKKAVNIFLPIPWIDKLQERRYKEKRTISSIIEMALEKEEKRKKLNG